MAPLFLLKLNMTNMAYDMEMPEARHFLRFHLQSAGFFKNREMDEKYYRLFDAPVLTRDQILELTSEIKFFDSKYSKKVPN